MEICNDALDRLRSRQLFLLTVWYSGLGGCDYGFINRWYLDLPI